MTDFHSGMAHAIEAMLEFKELHGHKKSSFAPVLKRFDRFCCDRYPNLSTLSRESVLDWLAVESKPKRNKMWHKTSIIRQFGKYLIAVGEEAYVLPERYVSKTHNFSPYLFTDDELTRLFKTIDHLSTEAPYVNMRKIAPVLFRLLYTCGLRPNEGRELKCANINLNNGELLVESNKKCKQRLIVLSDDMLSLCCKYDSIRIELSTGSDYFFPAADNNPFTHVQMRTAFKDYWAKANSTVRVDELPNVRPYDLRHRFASAVLHKWIDEGRDLYAMLPYLRAYMGHEHISDTAYYIHVLPENLLNSKGVDWIGLDKVIPGVAVWQRQ